MANIFAAGAYTFDFLALRTFFRNTLGPFRPIRRYSVRLTFSRPQAMMPVSPSRTSTSLCPTDTEGQISSLSTLQDQALLAELRRLLQVCQRQGRGLPPMPPGISTIACSLANHDISNNPSSTTLSAPSAPRPGPTAGTASAVRIQPLGKLATHLLTNSQRPATSPLTLTGK